MSETVTVAVGSMWVEDDKRLSMPPIITVVAIEGEYARISRGCGPHTRAKLSRFGKRGGYLPAPEMVESCS